MMQNALTDWYGNLAPRDQRILRYGAVAVAIILVIWVAWPLQRNLELAREQVRQQQADLGEMDRDAPTLAAAGPGRAATASAQSLVVLIDTTARESGLAKALTGTTPAGTGAMRVQLENADFNLLVGWLHRLATQQGVLVEDLTVTGNGGAGLVNVAVQLRPGK
jgi:general secretion pathway protein M